MKKGFFGRLSVTVEDRFGNRAQFEADHFEINQNTEFVETRDGPFPITTKPAIVSFQLPPRWHIQTNPSCSVCRGTGEVRLLTSVVPCKCQLPTTGDSRGESGCDLE